MPTVVIGVIPPPTVDTIDTRPRPRQRIGQPSCQSAGVLAQAPFHAVTLSIASQRQPLNLYLTTERFAVTIVQHVLDFPVIGLKAEVIVLLRRHDIESPTPLVGNLRLDDVTAHCIAVKGCRRALVSECVQVLRRSRIA